MNKEQFRKEMNEAIDLGLFVGARFIHEDESLVIYEVVGFSVNLNRDSLTINYKETYNTSSETGWIYVGDFTVDGFKLI